MKQDFISSNGRQFTCISKHLFMFNVKFNVKSVMSPHNKRPLKWNQFFKDRKTEQNRIEKTAQELINWIICFIPHCRKSLVNYSYLIVCIRRPATSYTILFYVSFNLNVMPLIRWWSKLFPLQPFIAPKLDVMSCLQARGTRDCNKGNYFKKGGINCCFNFLEVNFFLCLPS